jgi:hypothetical protein
MNDNYVKLKEKATLVLRKKGIEGFIARVACVVDISGSMSPLFKNGTVQETVERMLALGARFDDNNAIDMFAFGKNAHDLGELPESNFTGYVEREITNKYRLEGGTNYAPIMEMIVNKYYPNAIITRKKKLFSGGGGWSVNQVGPQGDPVYVKFVTDGDNWDKPEATKWIVESSKLGIFWQFVGIGKDSFSFLKKLDDMPGRFIDNANFFQVNDITQINDDELYERMLGEFPDWLKEAKQKNLY